MCNIKKVDVMKKKIGLIYGTFDLFHHGHLNALRSARRLCNTLIVGVFTDETVEQYKHKKPIIPFKDRAQIVAELRCVDVVLRVDRREVQNPDKVDFLFVSNKLYGNKLQMVDQKWQGSIIYIPYSEDISTGKIISKVFRCGLYSMGLSLGELKKHEL